MAPKRSSFPLVLIVLLACSCLILSLCACALAFSVSARSTPMALREGRPSVAETELAPTDASADRRPTGGEFRLPGGLPPTLDPALSQDSTSAQYIVEIFSGLVTASPDLELIPDIAENYELSPDGRVYRFHLRPNVRFHDGRAVTASDFKFSLERSCDPRTGSPIAATYLGDILGAREALSGRATELTGVRVVDDRTLEIEIDAPRPSFLAKLSHPVAFVVDRYGVDSPDLARRANGTGPFRLVEVVPRSRIVLEANRNFYRQPRPALDRVVFLLGPGHAVTMYENDELDIAPVGSSDLPRVTDPFYSLSQELTVSEQLATFYIGLNCQLEPFTDVKVRQAFAQALDRQKIVDFLYERTVPAAETIVPPTMPDYDNDHLAAPSFDPQAARELLAHSPYKGPEGLPVITLHVSSSTPQTDPVAEAIVVILEEHLGVTVEIEQVEWSVFLEELVQPRNPYQMFMLGWIADYPDPENFLNVLFRSDSGDNHSHYVNAEVDRLLAEASLEMDQERRHDLYLEAERIILAEAPIIPLYHDVEYWLTKPYVRDMHYPAMVVPHLQYVYLQK